jgi:hypothetical protein
MPDVTKRNLRSPGWSRLISRSASAPRGDVDRCRGRRPVVVVSKQLGPLANRHDGKHHAHLLDDGPLDAFARQNTARARIGILEANSYGLLQLPSRANTACGFAGSSIIVAGCPFTRIAATALP